MIIENVIDKKFNQVIQYHETLNEKLWDDDLLIPEVKTSLKKIAKAFIEYLKIDQSLIDDIILTGSNCNYNWTKYSDIDLHFVVDYDEIIKSCSDFDIDDCFNCKKSLWNANNDITIKGHDVEIYVQPKSEYKIESSAVFSLSKNKWIKRPEKKQFSPNERPVMVKYKELSKTINSIIVDDNNLKQAEEMAEKIKKLRKSGLEKAGEFSTENLTFKMLRANKFLDALYEYIDKQKSKNLSLK